jgi:RNA polymerase sigma factor (sigma-70 family)
MNTENLEPLLDHLCQGDMAAAKEVFLACEAYLRKIVRRQMPPRLQAKFDSVDVVQSVWADLVHGYREKAWQFPDVRRLQAFLVQVTRNRFNDKFRKHRIAFEREHQLGGISTSLMPACAEPQPREVLEAEDLWQRMLKLCPAEHRKILTFKRQGLSLDEIAGRTGLHPGSIRRILRTLASKLALQEPSDLVDEKL